MNILYTCADVAQRYNVKQITVWDWIRKGSLTAIKVGKSYRIRESDLATMEAKGETAKS